jgi:hypothetical protein
MTFEEFKKKLESTDSPEHSTLLSHVKKLIDKSRSDMAKNYSTWDEHDRVFQSLRAPDKEDTAAAAKGQPGKMIVPLTFSQIMTFVAFCVMSVTQNRRFFELEPTGTEDNPLAEPIELILERDLRKNQWQTFLVEFFLNIGRFSLAAAEVCYKEDYRYVRITKTETEPSAFGEETQATTTAFEKIPSFIGNKIYGISPYRFYPDTSLPLTRYQEGEFCGSEDVFSMSSLKAMGDVLFNLDKVPKMNEEEYKKRKENSRIDFGPVTRENPNLGASDRQGDADNMVKSGPVAVTKIVCDITPENFKVGDSDEGAFGTEDFPVRYIVWYANDKTIVRFEEAYFLHGMFPYILGQFIPDQHRMTNQSLADVCEQITNLITWKINAHVQSQRNSVLSKWIVDPAGVDTKTITDSTSPFIYLKKNAGLTGIDRYIKQFATVDTTQNVMKDVADLKELNEGVTGFSAQMQGQYSQGRRSATQDRVVAQGASARGKVSLGGIWDTAFEPLGKQLITNNRQEMDFETFKRIIGDRQWPANPNVPPQVIPSADPAMPPQQIPVPYTDEEIFSMFKSDPVSLATAEDFFVFDGTLPSEKAFLAQSLQEVLMQILSNPTILQVLGWGGEQVKELFNQVYLLRGVTPARLPAPAPAPTQQPPLSVVPSPPAATSGNV